MCCAKNKVKRTRLPTLESDSPWRGEGAYKEVISVAEFQNVDATPILMLKIEMKNPCEKACILTQ